MESKKSTETQKKQVIIYHDLSKVRTSDGYRQQRCCIPGCANVVPTYCRLCRTKPYLCDGICSLRYHNPYTSIDTGGGIIIPPLLLMPIQHTTQPSSSTASTSSASSASSSHSKSYSTFN
eukprot:TRINITY_DN8876_c0_g1_i1.p1 TRINITY_DN8876_c0_g1~~TRINITY_DN8876_c0_g1_i1.p1  ORF type:complete len:120 (-),score=16.58 TRINITY_DN8876_c0_g1_i1:59-418(-)